MEIVEIVVDNYELTQMNFTNNNEERMSIECNPDDSYQYEYNDEDNYMDDDNFTNEIVDNITNQLDNIQIKNNVQMNSEDQTQLITN